MTLEVLNFAFVFFSRRPRFKGAEILALAGLGIGLAGVQAIVAGFQLSDHARQTGNRRR